MLRTALSFPALLILVVSFTLNVPHLEARSTKNAIGNSIFTEIIGLPDEHHGCCGLRSVPERLSAIGQEYEYSRLTATYYSLRNGLSTSLMLNNKGPESILANPTLYSMAGTRLQLAPIVVPAASYIDVDMHQLLSDAPDEFREGSLKISYQGGDYQLGAQVKMTDPLRKLIWAEQLVYTSKSISSRLENVWWLPGGSAATRFVVSNTSSTTLTTTIRVEGTSPQQQSPYLITLAPWETRNLDILADLIGNANGNLQSKGGISIEHTGSPGDLLARMYIAKPNIGYSATASFLDPENTATQRWHGNGFRFRHVNGAALESGIALRNVGTQLSRVKGKIIYTKPNGDVATVTLPERQIPAGTTRVFDLGPAINQIPASVKTGGIEIEYDSPTGTIISSVQIGSPDGEHVFQVPMFDPQKMPSSAGGFPWKADGDFRTLVYIKNETDIERKYTVHLNFAGGSYTLGVEKLKANQSAEIDFKKLRDEQTPDEMGNLIPLSLDKGLIAWSVKGGVNKVLSGRSEQISLSGGVASTYSCANCCPDSVFQTGILPAGTQHTAVGGIQQFAPRQRDVNCLNTLQPWYVPEEVVWESTELPVASVDGDGLAEAVGAGVSYIRANWESVTWTNYGTYCEPTYNPEEESSLMEVAPRIDSITPEKGSVGGKISVSIDGAGFTPTTSIVPISGITFSNIERHGSTGISVVFAIAGNTTSGANDVKVTASGVSSNAKSFFVQIPKKARRDHTANTVVVDPGPGDIVDPFGNTVATSQCGAYRNLKYSLIDQNDEVLNLGTVDEEIGLTVEEVLSDIQANPPSLPSPAPKTTLTNNVAQFGDILAAFKVPPCTPPFSILLTQRFKVTVGQTIFNLSTENRLEITRSGVGQWTIGSTNQIP